MASAGSFAQAIRQFHTMVSGEAGSPGIVDEAFSIIVQQIATSVVYKSPVGNPDLWSPQSLPAPPGYVGGRFRANWQYGEGQPNHTITEEIDNDGGSTISRLTAAIPQDASRKVHYVSNALPYADRLENGWSTQAPSGMVALTELEFVMYVENAARAVQQ